MDDLFRLGGSEHRAAAIEAWLASQAPPIDALARAWVEELRNCGPDVRELVHDGLATFCVADARDAAAEPENGREISGLTARFADLHRMLRIYGRGARSSAGSGDRLAHGRVRDPLGE